MKRTTTALALAAALTLALSACSGDNTPASSTTTTSPAPESDDGAGPEPERGGFAAGRVESTDGTTVVIAGNNTKQKVTLTGSTTLRKTVTRAVADIKQGTCVTVMPNADGTAAERVEIMAADGGACAPNGGSGGAAESVPPPSTGGSSAPEPTETAPGADKHGGLEGDLGSLGGDFFGTTGTVVSVNEKSLVLKAADGEANTPEKTYALTAALIVTAEEKASASDVAVGMCVAATGEPGDGEALVADHMDVHEPVDGQCEQ